MTFARQAGSASEAERVFVARGLTKVYTSGEVEVHALRGVDLDIYSGEVVVLLGPSGSGSRRCSTLPVVLISQLPAGCSSRIRNLPGSTIAASRSTGVATSASCSSSTT